MDLMFLYMGLQSLEYLQRNTRAGFCIGQGVVMVPEHKTAMCRDGIELIIG